MGISKQSLIKFEDDLNKFAGKFKGDALKLTKEITTTAFKTIVLLSPVKTGAYVENHRIGIGGIDHGPPVYYPEEIESSGTQLMTPRSVSVKLKALEKLDLKLAQIKLGDRIVLSNNSHYADKVEYGWIEEKHIGYFPYTRAFFIIVSIYGGTYKG